MADIRFGNRPIFHIVTRIPCHKLHKRKLVNGIKKTEGEVLKGTNTLVNKHDFNRPVDKSKLYAEPFIHMVAPYLDRLVDKHSFGKVYFKLSISDVWFEQYTNLNTKHFNSFPNANYTNIYFLEKPKDLYLEFYDHATSTIYSLKDVNEGDILTVPSHIPCRVPENTTNKKLTLIIFNTQISVVDYGK